MSHFFCITSRKEEIKIDRQTMSAREAASYLGISYWLLLELIKRKQLKHIKAGRKILIRTESLDAWLAEQEHLSIQSSTDTQSQGRVRRIEV